MKLISSAFNGNILNAIHDLYDSAKSCVKMNGKLSYHSKYNIGMRQGENLSPLLFAIFLNDFDYSISRKYSGLNLLVDDVSVCFSDDDVEHFLKISPAEVWHF